MWCKPTIFGAVFTTALSLGAAWLACIGIVCVFHGLRGRAPGESARPRAPVS